MHHLRSSYSPALTALCVHIVTDFAVIMHRVWSGKATNHTPAQDQHPNVKVMLPARPQHCLAWQCARVCQISCS